MAEKQAQLNGAYYGPAIPPPNNHYHRPGRSSGCGCGWCLFSCLLKIIVTLVVVIGLAILIFWLVVRPNKVKFHVTDAKLSQFNLTGNNLHYNLSTTIQIRNPNKKIGIYYDYIEARAFYEDQRLISVPVPPFYQGHKNTSIINPSFQGQQIVILGTDELNQFNQEKSNGVFNIYVKLYLKLRFKIGKIKTRKWKPKIECDLKIPFNSADGRLAPGFETTKCDWDY